MKKIFLFMIFGFMSMASFAQNKIDLTVKWNASQNRYEVYGKPNFTNSAFTLGASQITVVVPASAPDASLTVTPVNGGTWGTAPANQVYAPTADANHDFYAVQTSGQAVALTANTETLLFYFTFTDGQCRNGIRLFVNGSDPSSSASGMKGGDYSNTIDNGLITDVYGANYSNTGTSCSTCSITAPELIK